MPYVTKIEYCPAYFHYNFSGCQKDVDKHTAASAVVNNSNTIRHGMVDSTGRWFGTSLGFLEDPDKFPDTVSEISLIHNGEASVEEITPGSHSLSSIGYYLPADKNISGDSCIFTAAVKDDSSIIEMDIMGTQNIAHITCIKNGDSTMLTLSVGNSKATSVVKAIDFSVYRNS